MATDEIRGKNGRDQNREKKPDGGMKPLLVCRKPHKKRRGSEMNIYEEKTEGAAHTREQYLTWLAEEVTELGGEISESMVIRLADALGENEDFDGLPCEVARAGGINERDLYLSLG